MRLPLLPKAVVAAVLLLPLSLQVPLAAAPVAEAQARVIVTFKADAPLGRQQALAVNGPTETAAQLSAERATVLGSRMGLGLRGGGLVSDRTQVMFASGISSAALVRRLQADSEIESVFIDQRRQRVSMPNDPLYGDGQAASPGPAVGQWYLRAPAGEVKSSINVEPAWALTAGRPQVVVAVLDTGVRFDHADLKRVAEGGKLLPGYDMIHDAVTAADGDGRDADPTDPGDFVTAAEIAANPAVFANCSPDPTSSWHGTQTASLIGALTDNGVGMASVGREVRVLPVRVLGKCGGFDSDIQAAMRWSAGLFVPGVPTNPNKAAVINLSLGSAGACGNGYPAVVAEVLAAGTTIVAAAGNSAGRAVGTPASCAGVIAVAALRHVGTKVGFSDNGPEITLSAPGGNCINIGPGEPCLYPIITARNGGITTAIAASSVYSDSSNYAVGTSFSSPLVAGTAALMVSAQPALTPADLRRLLQATARPFPTTGGDNGDGTTVPVCQPPSGTDQLQCYCTTTTCGAGMLDAGAAVQASLGVFARISVAPATPQALQPVQLSAADSIVAPGRTVASVRWVITDSGGIASGFSGAADGVTATIVPTGSGRFSVSATVTDSAGAVASASSSIDVMAVDPVPDPGGGGGGGGGGALGWPWLLGLLVSVVAVRVRLQGGNKPAMPRF